MSGGTRMDAKEALENVIERKYRELENLRELYRYFCLHEPLPQEADEALWTLLTRR